MAPVLFDVFGTLVDWYGGLVGAAGEVAAARGWALDVPEFVVSWRRAMMAQVGAIGRGGQPWQDLDEINRVGAARLLGEAGVTAAPEELDVLVAAWRRLDAWEDSAPALAALKSRGPIAPLSNGSVALLTDLAHHAGLPFDRIFGSDLFHAYKPSPKVYLGAREALGAGPGQAWLVAAHAYDLQAAAAHGFRTAFVGRPREWGGHQEPESAPAAVDLVLESLHELPDKLTKA